MGMLQDSLDEAVQSALTRPIPKSSRARMR